MLDPGKVFSVFKYSNEMNIQSLSVNTKVHSPGVLSRATRPAGYPSQQKPQKPGGVARRVLTDPLMVHTLIPQSFARLHRKIGANLRSGNKCI
jgi:hypothetical protein